MAGAILPEADSKYVLHGVNVATCRLDGIIFVQSAFTQKLYTFVRTGLLQVFDSAELNDALDRAISTGGATRIQLMAAGTYALNQTRRASGAQICIEPDPGVQVSSLCAGRHHRNSHSMAPPDMDTFSHESIQLIE